jgi:hypothetical protein
MRQKRLTIACVAGLPLLTDCATTPVSCQLQVAADFPVTFMDGHHAVVTIQISRQDFKMMVDSGASDTYLTTEAYERLDNDSPNEARISGYSTGLDGAVEENFAFIHDVSFGSTRLQDQILLGNDDIVTAKKMTRRSTAYSATTFSTGSTSPMIFPITASHFIASSIAISAKRHDAATTMSSRSPMIMRC